MESHPEGPQRRDRCLYHYFSAWNAMLRHDTLSAFQHQKSALKLAIEVGNPFFEVLCRLSLAQVLFELGDARKGIAHLQVVHSMARNIHNRMLEFMCLMAYAQIALEHGRERSGLNSLRYALKRGRENGYVHFLWWQPEVIAKLCARALEEGIETDYVRMLIRKRDLIPDKTSMTVQEWPWEFRIYTLGKFDVLKEEKPLGLMSKLQRKPMKLLKALVAFGSIDVNADRVADALWPHGEGDYAHQSLNTTLHRLRKLLDNDEAVLLKDGRLSLNIRFFWVDTLAFEHALGDINSVFKRGSNTISEDKVTELAEKVLHLYQGPFMEDDDDIPQYISLREKLRSKFLRAISQLARYWEETDQWDKAVEYYNRGLEVDHLAEGLYRGLIVCFHKLNRRAEAIEVYNRCRKTLSAELDVEPSPETTEIYNSLNKEG
jgi:DNA-binding SARP family transcriptional activator